MTEKLHSFQENAIKVIRTRAAVQQFVDDYSHGLLNSDEMLFHRIEILAEEVKAARVARTQLTENNNDE